MNQNKEIIENMKRKNKNLSKYACHDENAIRFNKSNIDIRTEFFKDIDKIIYSLSYIRYIDKTQVFSNNSNDMISKRITHVQMVSKIARTIGRALNLNEDLIEAASLGHDLGHAPFGHLGESILNKISLANSEGFFFHNVQSVRTLICLENHGKGNNVSVQVLDAIFCHNGETLQEKYEPAKKNKEEFLNEYFNSYKNIDIIKNVKPMTLEGCVVRISDIIAYIGKDIDDAIRLKKIKYSDIPEEITNVLGKNNSEIINTIVLDIINNSINRNYIKMSKNVFIALQQLISFNYKNIYLKVNSKKKINEYEKKFNILFKKYHIDILNNNQSSDIFTIFINDMTTDYYKNNSPARIVLDFISGMTDDFFEKQYDKCKVSNI